MSKKNSELTQEGQVCNISKRKFITGAAYGTAGVGALCVAYPLIDSMNPSADVAALASIEVDISGVKVGEQKKVMWRGKPIFIRRRTKEEIESAEDANLGDYKDPQLDSERVKSGKEEWLIAIGICTHLGCVPNLVSDDGWFCPCHGSVYDSSARIVRGPAPKNLEIPPYEFISDNIIKIG